MFGFQSERPVRSKRSRKHTVIGEVTCNFELAKPWNLCIHMFANFEWDPLRLVAYRANHKILVVVLKLEVNFKFRNQESFTCTLNHEWNLKFTAICVNPTRVCLLVIHQHRSMIQNSAQCIFAHYGIYVQASERKEIIFSFANIIS